MFKQVVSMAQALYQHIAYSHTTKKSVFFVAGFCDEEIHAITNLVSRAYRQPQYKIISEQFNEHIQRIVFTFRRFGSPHILSKSAHQVSRDKKLLLALSQEDAHRVGYATALEQVMLENKLLKHG